MYRVKGLVVADIVEARRVNWRNIMSAGSYTTLHFKDLEIPAGKVTDESERGSILLSIGDG